MNKILKFSLGIMLLILSCNNDNEINNETLENNSSVDINGDGKLNILILGTSRSIRSSSGFSSSKIAEQLENILTQDESLGLDINVASENIYKSKEIDFGLGQAGTVFNMAHFSHSLMQYYYWPEGKIERWNSLSNQTSDKWDYIIIGADPYIISKLPGYYGLGVNKFASKIREGGAKPLLLMVWGKEQSDIADIEHFEEFTYRVADGVSDTALETIPAGLVWKELPGNKKDTAVEHPTPNGAYLAAASIYAQLFNKSATASNYNYDASIANLALSVKNNEQNNTHYAGESTFILPFKSCDITENILNYNHTGTSSENGILNGLQWVIAQSNKTLVSGGESPINFNYGMANTNFEPNKRYKINPSLFDFSLGFPMQDHSNCGNVSMLYGLDKRLNEQRNATDLGVAFYMEKNNELPNARAIPIRTLYAQLKEAIPDQSAYGDNWHMNGDLDKASGTFMYTMLTGECVLGEEPANVNSSEWKSWMGSKNRTSNSLYFNDV